MGIKKVIDGDKLAKLSKVKFKGTSGVSEESSEGAIMDAYNEIEFQERQEEYKKIDDRIKEIELRLKTGNTQQSKSIEEREH